MCMYACMCVFVCVCEIAWPEAGEVRALVYGPLLTETHVRVLTPRREAATVDNTANHMHIVIDRYSSINPR